VKHRLRDLNALIRARGVGREGVPEISAEEMLASIVEMLKLREKWSCLSRYNSMTQAADLALAERMGNAISFHRESSRIGYAAANAANAGYTAARAKYDSNVVLLLSCLNDNMLAKIALANAQDTPIIVLVAELVAGWGLKLYQECLTAFHAAAKETSNEAMMSTITSLAARGGKPQPSGGGDGDGGGGPSESSGAAKKRKRELNKLNAERAALGRDAREKASKAAGGAASTAAGAPAAGAQGAAGAATTKPQSYQDKERRGGKKPGKG
jgi:hypothetical protein